MPELWTEAREAVKTNETYYRVMSELRPAYQRWDGAGRRWKRLIADDVLLGEASRLVSEFPKDVSKDIRGFVEQSRFKARLWFSATAAAAVVFLGVAVAAGYLYTEASRSELKALQSEAQARAAETAAAEGRDEAERNLRLARVTLDGVVVDVADGLKNVEGMRAASRNRILDRVRSSVEELASKAPDDSGIQETRWKTLIALGEVFGAVGDIANARVVYDEGLRVARAFSAKDGANADWRRYISFSLNRVGDSRRWIGDEAGALKDYEEGLEVIRELSGTDESNTEWRRDTAVSLNKVGGGRSFLGDTAGALKAFEESLEIARKLASTDPSNDVWQRDISISLNKIGEVKSQARDGAGALRAFEEDLEISRKLSTKDSTNTEWQRDVLVTLSKIGELRLGAGDKSGAFEAYQESLDISRKLAVMDKTNFRWRVDLMSGLYNISFLQSGDARRASLDQATQIADDLAAKGQLTADQKSWPEFLRKARKAADQ